MARINLLPWREQLREERKKRFLAVLAATLIAALLLVLLADRYLDAAIERQNARNEFVRSEIAQLDIQIKEIKALRERRQSWSSA
jgi:type IV pilus assembly protein PilN